MHRHTALANRLARLLRAERGLALVSTLGVVSFLALAGTSVVAFSATNYGSASRSKADMGAYALAEAGVNNAAAVLNAAADPTVPTLLPARTSTYEGGTVTWSGSYDAATSVWTVTATGELRNPTGVNAAPVRRTLTAKISVSASGALTQTLSNQAWNYVVATHTGSQCDETLSNSVTWSARLFVVGNLCLSTGATITAGPVVVGGVASLGSTDNFIGSSASPVSEVHVVGGCKYGNARTPHTPCSSSDHVYATVSDANPAGITPPTPDWDRWYNAAMPGPRAGCTASTGAVPAFDNDSTRNNSVTTAFNLTPASSYSCASGTGQLAWDATTHVLTVNGTVFIDGSAKADNAQVDTYVGQGVLYLSGTFYLNGKLCALVSGTGCDFASWDPNNAMFEIVANGVGPANNVPSGDSVYLTNGSSMEGGFYGTGALDFGNNANVGGPMLGSQIVLSNNVTTASWPVIQVPAGMPGSPTIYAQPLPPQYFSG